mgnify:CR=1 FL=1
MSFSIDLWNGFDIIKSSFTSNNKRMKQILDILTLYSSLQKEYCKGLDNLYKEAKEYNLSNNFLDESINSLINSFKVESDKHKMHCNNINRNISEIKEKFDKIKSTVASYLNDSLQNKETFNKILNNLILKQEAFYKSCRELSYCIAEIQGQKILNEEKPNNKENKNNDKENNSNKKEEKVKEKEHYKDVITKHFKYYLNNNILNLPNRKENLIKKTLENKKEYINCITEAENERKKYNKTEEDLLNNLQKLYKSLIFLIQTMLNNYIKDKIKTYSDIIEVNEASDKDKYSKINYKQLTFDFIINNATKEFPMNNIEFIPYKINKDKIIQKVSRYNEMSNDDQNKIIKQIKNYITNYKINIYENEYLRPSFINKTGFEKLKKPVDKFRRSGSSGMLEIKNIGNKNILVDFSSNNDVYNKSGKMDNNIIINKAKNKDDIMLHQENEKKNNFIFIKDFVYKLIKNKVIEKDENKMYSIYDIYSDNSSDENEKEKGKENKSKIGINEESYIYNQLLFDFMELISLSNKDHNEYLDYFIKILSHDRSMGNFVLDENGYKMFVNIFNFILVNYKTNNNFIKNIILLSQTFYKVENQKTKIYILNGLKNHAAFNNADTWHRAINYSLSLSTKSNDNYSLSISNKEEYLKNLNKVAMNVIISYLFDLKLSTNEKEVYEQVKNFYITIYKLDKKCIEQQIEVLLGDKDDKKEKKEKNNHKIENEKEEIKLEITNNIKDNIIIDNIGDEKNNISNKVNNENSINIKNEIINNENIKENNNLVENKN